MKSIVYNNFYKIMVSQHEACFVLFFRSEIYELYPNKFLTLDESRIYVLNTLFNLPETYVIACLIDFFTKQPNSTQEAKGLRRGELFMSYKSIFQDVRSAMDWIHEKGDLKGQTVQDTGSLCCQG